MTCKIQILSIIDLPLDTFREVIVTVDKEGVLIAVSSGSPRTGDERYANHNWSMYWDEITNYELLANSCEYETVAVFRRLVEVLGKVYACRAQYEELL